MTARDDDKRLAAEAAVAAIDGGMIVGLGTGSTAAFAIQALGRRVAAGLTITAVATSLATEAAARAAGIPIVQLDGLAVIDLAIDGVDEIDGRLRAIKGAGGAMLREKVVAAAARRMIAITDGTKRVDRLGAAAVPVEVLPAAQAFVAARIVALGAAVRQRVRDVAPYRTDQGNAVLDCHFPPPLDPAAVARRLAAIPGLLGHGLFLDEVDTLLVAAQGVVTRFDRPGRARGSNLRPGPRVGAAQLP